MEELEEVLCVLRDNLLDFSQVESKSSVHWFNKIVNPLRLLNILKHIKNKSRSYYRTFPIVSENTTRHSVFSNLLRNPAHAHSVHSYL